MSFHGADALFAYLTMDDVRLKYAAATGPVIMTSRVAQ